MIVACRRSLFRTAAGALSVKIDAMDSNKQPNIQKRDTTFKQEHGAVTRLVNRQSEKAVSRAVRGAAKLLGEENPKQALNVLTLAKPLLPKVSTDEQADYYLALADIQIAMNAAQPAIRALTQAKDVEGLSEERLAEIEAKLADLS